MARKEDHNLALVPFAIVVPSEGTQFQLSEVTLEALRSTHDPSSSTLSTTASEGKEGQVPKISPEGFANI